MGKAAVRNVDSDRAINGIVGNRVIFTMGKTINIGEFESIRVDYGECRVVEDGQSFEEVRKHVIKTVKTELMKVVNMVERSME